MTQFREEVSFTKGRILVRGQIVKRGQAKRADYVLYVKPNIPLAVIEAKDNTCSVGDGLQQALGYAKTLQLPFVFSSNGDGFVFHDRTETDGPPERNLRMDEFPSPTELSAKYRAWKGLPPEAEALVLQNYYSDGSERGPRYYQASAVNAVVEAVARGQNRLLLVMATGTGKTYTAFQIIWRLWRSGRKKRVLFLVDRNVLADQAMVNDFRPFGPAMAKLSTGTKVIEREDGSEAEIPTAIDRRRRIDTSYEIYLALYQAITGPDEKDKLFKELSRDFFNLIVVDECHRGSAADDSAWREILEYFSSATQIGMTATPKETKYVSNSHYFGPPVYSYSLKQGIDDGFLAPYKVIKVHIDRDIEGYRPEPGKLDKEGREVADRLYNQKDFDRSLVIDERTTLVAERVSDFLKGTSRYQKTIVFCVDTEHAARMRQALVNANRDLCLDHPRYVMRITANDKEGVEQLDSFIDPEARFPVIVTTSQLLSTGVDAQTCRVIVLDREIGSMTEFKQIIGRGTRIHEDTRKYFFTIIDFRKATNLFADPDFDGDPVQIYNPGPDDPMVPPDAEPPPGGREPGGEGDGEIVDGPAGLWVGHDDPTPYPKTYVDGVAVRIVAERTQHLGGDGRLVTESLRDYTRTRLRRRYASLDDFLTRWKQEDRKEAVLEQLEAEGLQLDALLREVGADLDAFDLICHVAYDQPPLTRRERAEHVRTRDVFTKYGPQARAVLEALLQKYEDEGVIGLNDPRILQIAPFDAMGTPVELVRRFGNLRDFERAVHDLQTVLYEGVA